MSDPPKEAGPEAAGSASPPSATTASLPATSSSSAAAASADPVAPTLAAPTAEPERRDEDRAAITLKVDYKRLNTFFADYTKNISRGGTFIRTSKPLETGTEFVFVLTVPEPNLDNAPVRLELTGEVKWVVSHAEATADKPAGMGIQFVFKDEAERLRVERFVADLMRSSLGPHLADKLLARARTEP